MSRIVGMGARAAIGLDPIQIALVARANKREPRETRLDDKRGRAVGTCRIGGLGEVEGYARLVCIAIPALRQAAQDGAIEHAPLLIAAPEPGRPDDDERFENALVQEVAAGAGIRAGSGSGIVRVGHAGFGIAVERAEKLLGEGAERVVVGGVDSFQHRDVLRWLDDACRLHALGAEDGFVPGEGAAFFVLDKRGDGIAEIAEVRAGREPGGDDAPNVGTALTELLQAASARRGDAPWVLADLNGERHRRREWELAAFRGGVAKGARVDRGPEQLGDVGAASGALLTAIACGAWQTGAAPAEDCLVATMSEGPERAVIRLVSLGA